LLAKKRPGYDAITRLSNVREDLFTAGLRPRLATPMLLAILARLKDREQSAVLSKAGYRSAEAQEVLNFDKHIQGVQKELSGKKVSTPLEAYKFLEKLPVDQIAYIMAESNNSAAVSKIRAYLNKWRPLRSGLLLVVNELTALGMPAGAKFDAIVEQVFGMQLTGRGKTPEEREKILRKLSGIKEQPKKKEKEKKSKAAEKSQAALAMGTAAKQKHADAETAAKKAGKAGGKGAHTAADKREPARHGAGRSSGKKTHARK
jgi:hypothetical protein